MKGLRVALLAPVALAAAALAPTTEPAATAAAAPGVHAHSSVAIAVPRVGDLTVARLTILASGRVTPRLHVTVPTVRPPSVYGAVVAVAAHRYTAQVVVLRRRGDSGAPLRWSYGPGTRAYLEWQAHDVLEHSGVAPGLLGAGADPRTVCSAFSARFHRIAGPALALPPRAVGRDACLLAAHDRQPMPGLEKATHLRVPAGFLNAYPRVTVAVEAFGSVVGTAAGIACGARCTGYVRAGHGGVLTPLPASGWAFAGWRGACTGTGACAVTGSAAFSATAVFKAVARPAPPSSSAAPPPSRTGAQLYEYAVHLTYPTVAAGAVQIVAANVGEDDHQLAIRDEQGNVLGQTVLLHPHDEATLEVALTPGTYYVFCPLSNHEALGMIATLTVQRA